MTCWDQRLNGGQNTGQNVAATPGRGGGMSNSNAVPEVNPELSVKTLAFPFQRGQTGFPAMAKASNSAFANIIALIFTGLNERVMSPDLGVNADEYVFENMTPIQQVRLSNTVATAIERFIPGVRVDTIIPQTKKYEDGIGAAIVFDIVYTVSGQSERQQVIMTPTSRGI